MSARRMVAACALFLTAGIIAALLVMQTAYRAEGTVTDPFCVSLPEAHTVHAGENVSAMKIRVAPEAQPRWHMPHTRDIDGCGRGTVFRYHFHATSSGRAVVSWRWLSCRMHSECVVVTTSGGRR